MFDRSYRASYPTSAEPPTSSDGGGGGPSNSSIRAGTANPLELLAMRLQDMSDSPPGKAGRPGPDTGYYWSPHDGEGSGTIESAQWNQGAMDDATRVTAHTHNPFFPAVLLIHVGLSPATADATRKAAMAAQAVQAAEEAEAALVDSTRLAAAERDAIVGEAHLKADQRESELTEAAERIAAAKAAEAAVVAAEALEAAQTAAAAGKKADQLDEMLLGGSYAAKIAVQRDDAEAPVTTPSVGMTPF
jgi:hypothetical protein